ncbi:MAG TPA: response regulator transcription factor [Chitinophagaceae bacterium]|nr:response regulator transcription factor [Chitinophagaceae bacterium]
MPLRLVIADDHPLLLDGLKKVLEEMDETEIIFTAGNGLELISLLRRTAADMVLLDLQMPKLDGIDSLKIIRRDFPKLKIIIFSNYGQPKLIRETKILGASGYLLKNSPSLILKEAIKTVAAGGSWFKDTEPEPKQSALLVNDFMKKYQLTSREIEIICKIAEGLTSKEIAGKLFVSEFTINTHRRNICRKLNIYTPVGLLNFAKEHGLVL